MLCERDGGFSDLDEAQRLLKKGFYCGLIDMRVSGDGWPLHVWGVWNDIVFEGHYGGNREYHGYPLQKDDPMLEKIRTTCDGRKYHG